MWRVEPVLGAKNSPFGEMMWSCKCFPYVSKMLWYYVYHIDLHLSAPVSSTNKTDRHDITEILLKVVLNTISHVIVIKWSHYQINIKIVFPACNVSSEDKFNNNKNIH
jgi:hypothetical protein